MGRHRPDGIHVAMLVRNTFTHDTRVEKEAASLHAAGYRVTIIADAGPGLPAQADREGVSIVRVNRRFGSIPALRFLAGELQRVSLLVKLRPDILHAHDSNALLAVASAAARLRRPYVYDAHELWLGRPPRGRSRAYAVASRLWYRLLQRLTVPRAAACLTVSAPIADHLARSYRLGEVVLVENYPPSRNAREDRVLSLRGLPGGESIPHGARLVLYIGGLMGGRGLEGVVDAMTSLPAAHLVLLGDGPLAVELLARSARLGIAGRVHRLGPVSSDDVIAYARSADVGVAPLVDDSLNNRYSLPNKLFQYLAAGLPVVASQLPQIRAVVAGAGAGVLVDFTRIAAVADALRGLLDDPDAARAMGRRGRRAVEDRFNWEEAGGRLLSAYDRLARDRR